MVTVLGKVFEDGIQSEKHRILQDFWRLIMTIVEVDHLRDSFNFLHDEQPVSTEQMIVQIRNLFEKAVSKVVKSGFEDLIWRTLQKNDEIGLKAQQVYQKLHIKQPKAIEEIEKANVERYKNIGRKFKENKKITRTNTETAIIEEAEDESDSADQEKMHTKKNKKKVSTQENEEILINKTNSPVLTMNPTPENVDLEKIASEKTTKSGLQSKHTFKSEKISIVGSPPKTMSNLLLNTANHLQYLCFYPNK